MTACKFFMQGSCRNGDSCRFVHGNDTNLKTLTSGTVSSLETSGFLSKTAPTGAISTPCVFFARGKCNKGEKCQFLHSHATVAPTLDQTDFILPIRGLTEDDNGRPTADSRAKIQCKFLSYPGGCQKDACPYSHVTREKAIDDINTTDYEEEQEEENDDDFVREFLGASVHFDDFGQVSKISLPTDFSLARITGLAPGTDAATVIDILQEYGFHLGVECVRIHEVRNSTESAATVKVDDPSFAEKLRVMVNGRNSDLKIIPLSTNNKWKSARKVHTSWHKASRSVWLNFGNGDIANRVACKFNEKTYKCLGQPVRSLCAKESSSGRGRGGSYNPVAWTVILQDVPGEANKQDISNAIFRQGDKPRHIEMGSVSYNASDAEVSVAVRSLLEEYGPLDNFSLASTNTGKRRKATVWFQNEADAKSACSLNNKPIEILRKGKLTVTQIQTMKIKIPTRIYNTSRNQIEEARMTWTSLHLFLSAYSDASNRFTTLKLEGEMTQDLDGARKTLNEILNGKVLTYEGNDLWHPALSSNKQMVKILNSVEREFDVVITQDKTRCQLNFHGLSEKYRPTAHRIFEVLQVSSDSHEINLDPDRLAWAIHGGFKSIIETLGKDVAVFDTVSKKIVVHGTPQQYTTAAQMIDHKSAVGIGSISTNNDNFQDCPVCFDEPETPVLTSCNHRYCLDCFERLCMSTRSAGNGEFKIQCCGDTGTCSTIFTLQEVRKHLPSLALEKILKSSLEAFIQCQPNVFRYCPTPGCDFVYRCSTKTDMRNICANCFEENCTYCHARHGHNSCAEYKDIKSGGTEKLEKLKRELNIKDCPRCTTPIEKTEGCNHITCEACKAHICWVCMALFSSSDPCYKHMREEHGGIGLDHLHQFEW